VVKTSQNVLLEHGDTNTRNRRRELEIIGVSKNAHYGDLKDDTPPVVYIPYNQGTEPPLNEAREAIESPNPDLHRLLNLHGAEQSGV
jgi:hypothetical protein